MKLGRIIDPRFQSALQKLISQPVSLRAAFKLKGISAKITEEIKKFDEVRHDALERYGTRGADGDIELNEDRSVKLSATNMQAFVHELNELTQTDLEIGQVKLSDLGDIKLTGEEVLALDDLLTE